MDPNARIDRARLLDCLYGKYVGLILVKDKIFSKRNETQSLDEWLQFKSIALIDPQINEYYFQKSEWLPYYILYFGPCVQNSMTVCNSGRYDIKIWSYNGLTNKPQRKSPSPLILKSVTLSLIHLKFASINKGFKQIACITTSLTDRMETKKSAR